jgi:stage IV sporulation protein FB
MRNRENGPVPLRLGVNGYYKWHTREATTGTTAMLGNAAPTPMDLRFSCFGIPVRVHPFFWVAGALGGWEERDFNFTLLWIGCLFVSILVHERGHALAARSCGYDPEIVLYHFGGYASYYPTSGHTMKRAVYILMSGPGAGFVLFGIVWGLELFLLQAGLFADNERAFVYLFDTFLQMKHINLWWGLVNLLPVFPLDGGQISRELLTHFRPGDGLSISLKLSIFVGAAAALYFLSQSLGLFPVMLFAALAAESYQHLQAIHYR